MFQGEHSDISRLGLSHPLVVATLWTVVVVVVVSAGCEMWNVQWRMYLLYVVLYLARSLPYVIARRLRHSASGRALPTHARPSGRSA